MAGLVDLRFLSGNRREKAVFDGILNLLGTVAKTVDAFEASVSAWAVGDAKSANDMVQKCSKGRRKQTKSTGSSTRR